MPKKIPKKAFKWIIGSLVVLVIAFIGFRYWKSKQSALPEGIVSGNGRIEAKLADVAAKEPLRVKQILVNEGDLVKPGQVLAQLDTTTLEASLAEAKASVAAAEERLAVSHAAIAKQKSEIELATIEVGRSQNLVREGAGSRRELDVRRNELATAKARLGEAEAMLKTATMEVEVARANAQTIQTRIADATLKSPVTGRVLYRLAEPGEVLSPGGAALTLVNLEDVYMEIFLPSNDAARARIGSEARITIDVAPDRPIPGFVSFVSPEAQFTPKQVETKSERETLMFRVKIQIPEQLASRYVERIRTGIRGVGYVKLDPNAAWPARLRNVVAPQAESQWVR
ncbi:efflux RND transporter periplasmic adaptor subunit [Myxococcaceae bacterium GXIMD 01537]